LYYTVGDTSNSYGDENDNGIVFIKDMDSDEIRGYTIMNFQKTCREKPEVYKYLKSLLNMKDIMNVCNVK
jgi:hypothetical protein